jgi:hypothetical protein
MSTSPPPKAPQGAGGGGGDVDPVLDQLEEAFRPKTHPAAEDLSKEVPDAMVGLLQDWLGRGYIGGTHLQFLGDRIRRHGADAVRRALEIGIKNGANGKWPYLDAVLANGAAEGKAKESMAEIVKRVTTKIKPTPRDKIL